jgi:replicative DNA helicase
MPQTTDSTATPRVVQLSDLISDFVADTEAAALALGSGRPRGPVTSLRSLDDALGGFLAPGVHILQAAPGAGKTAFALQTAARCEFPALFVSAEMGMLELFRRLISRETGTFLGKLKTGELGATEAMRLAVRTVEKVPHLAIMDATRGHAAPELIRDAAEGLRSRAQAAHVLVIVDSLQIWARGARSARGELSAATEYDLINAALDSISDIAADLNCPVLAVSHRNRAGQKEGGMHAGKGSGDLEYMAETVIDLNRDKDAQPDAQGEVGVTVAIHKNRHGSPGVTFPVRFCGRLQEFREGR